MKTGLFRRNISNATRPGLPVSIRPFRKRHPGDTENRRTGVVWVSGLRGPFSVGIIVGRIRRDRLPDLGSVVGFDGRRVARAAIRAVKVDALTLVHGRAPFPFETHWDPEPERGGVQSTSRSTSSGRSTHILDTAALPRRGSWRESHPIVAPARRP